MRVIDFHMHITKADQYQPWFLDWMKGIIPDPKTYLDSLLLSPKEFLKYMDSQEIEYAVCLAETNPIVTGSISNKEVAEFCKVSHRLIPFANINPYFTNSLTQSLDEALKMGHRGIKLYPSYQHFYPNNPRLYPLYARAEELGIPIMFHTGTSVFPGARLKYSDPIHLDDVAVDFPRLKIILCHGGRGFWYDVAFTLARLHRYVYIDVTGLPPKKLLEYFPELDKVASKVLFGSDWPAIIDIKANVKQILSLPLEEDTKTAILYENAKMLLDL